MLIKFLKLFGLDVPAEIDAVTSGIESRLEWVSERIKQEIQDAVVIAAFYASAFVAGAMAVGVGLLALYRWIAEESGVYVGLGVEAAILSLVAIILTAAAMVKRRTVKRTRIELPRYTVGASAATPNPNLAMNSSAVDADAEAPKSDLGTHFRALPSGPMSPAPTASVSDLVEPLAFFLSKVATPPKFGNSIVDDLVGSLRTSAHGTAKEAIDRSANVIRHGARADLVILLAGAAFVGWMLTRRSQPE